jgi:hypothetical protein
MKLPDNTPVNILPGGFVIPAETKMIRINLIHGPAQRSPEQVQVQVTTNFQVFTHAVDGILGTEQLAIPDAQLRTQQLPLLASKL